MRYAKAVISVPLVDLTADYFELIGIEIDIIRQENDIHPRTFTQERFKDIGDRAVFALTDSGDDFIPSLLARPNIEVLAVWGTEGVKGMFKIDDRFNFNRQALFDSLVIVDELDENENVIGERCTLTRPSFKVTGFEIKGES